VWILWCVGVLVICVLVFTVFCIVCAVFFVLIRLCIFILICCFCTSVRTIATEWKLNRSSSSSSSNDDDDNNNNNNNLDFIPQLNISSPSVNLTPQFPVIFSVSLVPSIRYESHPAAPFPPQTVFFLFHNPQENFIKRMFRLYPLNK